MTIAAFLRECGLSDEDSSKVLGAYDDVRHLTVCEYSDLLDMSISEDGCDVLQKVRGDY